MSDKGKPVAPLEATQDLNDLVFRDDLTQIYNRRFFYRYLRDEVAWGDAEGEPLSLLMIDLDHFKQINDRYGHLEGDRALIHVSKHFREQVGDAGHVIRYAGDEFAVLLPGMGCADAGGLANRILETLHESEFRLEAVDKVLPLGLSIGVSSFPEHASEPKNFIESADRALYASKRAGRDRVSLAGDEANDEDYRILDNFPSKTTIGRDRELEMFRGLLDTPGWPNNSIVLVRGLAGTGKTRFLRDVENETGHRHFTRVFHACEERDAEQPYHMFARTLEAFARQIPVGHRDQNLSSDEIDAIRFLSPDFFGDADSVSASKQPEGFLESLLAGTRTFLGRVASGEPLVLLVDDVQHADEPSLEVLGALLGNHRVPMLMCAALRERGVRGNAEVRTILGVTPHKPHEHVSLTETRLAALSPSEIGQMIRALFPGIRADRNVVHRVWNLTKGNPFFTEEILKRLVQDELLVRSDDGWKFEEIPWDDLPDSLEAVVREHLSTVDVETAQLLEQASVLGSRFRTDVLGAITGLSESQILEVLDRATEAGLLRPVRTLDDGEFEFLSSTAKEVQEARLGDDRRAAIHEKVGDYEEQAHADDLDRFSGRLKYHYDRSANPEKGARFADPFAAAGDVGDVEVPAIRRARARIREADTPLTANEMHLMRNVLRYFSAALKNRMLYPNGSRIIDESTRDLFESMQEVFKTCRVVTLSNAKEDMLINGVKVDPRHFVTGNREFLRLLQDYNILSITITRDVEYRELEGVRDLLYLRSKEDGLDHEFWDRNLDEREIRHVSVDQRVYVIAGQETGGDEDGDGDGDRDGDGDVKDETPEETDGVELDADLRAILDTAMSGRRNEDIETVVREILRLLEAGTPREKLLGIQLFQDFLERLCELKDDERAREISEHLLEQLDQEISDRAFGPIARALGEAICTLIQRGKYEIATRVIRYLGYRERDTAQSQVVAREARRALHDVISSASFDLVLAELLSEDPRRQGDAREILLGFNDLVVEPLIRVIKETDDYRTRKFTSLILHSIGSEAVSGVRSELTEDLPPDQYRRLLGVLDTFDEDFADQITAALCHDNSSIRAEAAKLLRKIRADIHNILLGVLRDGAGGVITEAILQLGRLKTVEAVPLILDKIAGEDVPDPVLYEGCLALGRIGDTRAIDALVKIFGGAKGLFRRRHHSSKVRFAAAWALAQFDHDGARDALRRARRDRDTEIRALVSRSLQ